jgi:glutathione S-transferase
MFGQSGAPKLKLYRDSAAWCPYCEKVGLHTCKTVTWHSLTRDAAIRLQQEHHLAQLPTGAPALQVWLQLEEKRIPYEIEKINMRCYGAKPRAFMEMVPSGLLPVMELNSRVIIESDAIMAALEARRSAVSH